MKSKNSFSLKFRPFVTDTGPRRPNVLPMLPTRQKELATPGLALDLIIYIFFNDYLKNFFECFSQDPQGGRRMN
jgi:hypothetical protein